MVLIASCTSWQIHFAPDVVVYYKMIPDLWCLSSDGWSRTSHACTRNEFGVWELTIPYKADGSSPIPHGSKVKVSVNQQQTGHWKCFIAVRNSGPNNHSSKFQPYCLKFYVSHKMIFEILKLINNS